MGLNETTPTQTPKKNRIQTKEHYRTTKTLRAKPNNKSPNNNKIWTEPKNGTTSRKKTEVELDNSCTCEFFRE